MFNFKKKPQNEPISVKEEPKTDDLKHELADLKLQSVMKKIAEQEIIIRRLLELVTMNIEHKAYDKFLLPKIIQIRNLLDKR